MDIARHTLIMVFFQATTLRLVIWSPSPDNEPCNAHQTPHLWSASQERTRVLASGTTPQVLERRPGREAGAAGYFLSSSICEQTIVYIPPKMNAVNGSCVVVPCTFTNSIPDTKLKIIWFLSDTRSMKEVYNSHDSSSIDKSFKGRTTLVGDLEKGNCTLKIEKLRTSDSQRYCYYIGPIEAEKNTSCSSYTTIQVSTHATDVEINNPGAITKGDTVKMYCSGRHTCPSSPPSIKWNFKGHPVKTLHVPVKDGEWKLTSVLSYSANASDNMKKLQCTIYNSGRSAAKTRILNILYAPNSAYINSTHENGQVKEGDTVILNCVASSNPHPTHYIWYKDNNMLNFNHTQSIFQIVKMNEAESGSYYCVAYNDIGSATSLPVNLNCIPDLQSSSSYQFPLILGGVSGIVVILLAVFTAVMLRKKCKAYSSAKAIEAESSPNIYMNIEFAAKPKINEENPYTALNKHSMSPDYEDLKLGSHLEKGKEGPSLQETESIPDYEEVIPQNISKNGVPVMGKKHAKS